MERVLLDGDTLTLEEVAAVAARRARAELAPGARDRVRRARALVEARLQDGEAHYGINTGFGTFAEVRIDRADLEKLQRNLVLSHAAGVGAPLPVANANDETWAGFLPRRPTNAAQFGVDESHLLRIAR